MTYSVIAKRLEAEAMKQFLLRELDGVGLGHNTFAEDAIDLIVRSAEGILRRARNLAVGSLIDAAGNRTRTVGIEGVNRVLRQPHWQKDVDYADF